MENIFKTAISQLALFRKDPATKRLATAITEVTGIPLTAMAAAERAALAQGSLTPLRRLLENRTVAKVNHLRYRMGLKRALRHCKAKGHICANKFEFTITTERGAIQCEADIYLVAPTNPYSKQRALQIEVRYTIYTGFKKRQFRQNLTLTSHLPKQQKPQYQFAPIWSKAA